MGHGGKHMNSNLRIVGLMTFVIGLLATLTLAVSATKAKAGDEQFDAHMCATIYYAVAGNPNDQNYRAMQFRYYAFSEFSSQEAAEKEIARAALALRKAVDDGRIEPATVFYILKNCARVQKLPEPEISYSLWPQYASPPASRPIPAATGSNQAAACESASERYRSTLRSMPGRLEAKGPRKYKSCDRPGPMCNMVRDNADWYYEMGRICSELKPIQEDIRRYCGETVQDLDDC